jgi:predicted pyridoxine 5'-phosphate oxidase superfamily flavin-nucleotide-binding protein
MPSPGDVAFGAEAKALQTRFGSREAYARRDEKDAWRTVATPELAAFIAQRDSFYFATASASGQPYVQHRGGPVGFLKVLDERTLAFADFRGNKQYITAGNLVENPKAFIFLMDYANRRRIKLWGEARIIEGDEALLARLDHPGYPAKVERAIVFSLALWDPNCSQHIVRRFAQADVAAAAQALHGRIAELEGEVAELRLRLAQALQAAR